MGMGGKDFVKKASHFTKHNSTEKKNAFDLI